VTVPVPLLEVIESRPARVVCRSRTAANEDAIVAGSAPGRFAVTVMVGYATVGSSLIGRVRYAITPKSAIPVINRLVAIVASNENVRQIHRPPGNFPDFGLRSILHRPSDRPTGKSTNGLNFGMSGRVGSGFATMDAERFS
jgi:hypothetical protein